MRSSILERASDKAGLPPGSPVPVGVEPVRPRIRRIRYDTTASEEGEIALATLLDELAEGPRADTVTWIDVVGLADADAIEAIGRAIALHPLAVEDVLHVGQRPKAERYENVLFVVVKMVRMQDAAGDLDVEQVSLALADGVVVTFQEREGDVFEAVRRRIRTNLGALRRRGADYLAYALIDAVVDAYFAVIEAIDERAERLEDAIAEDSGHDATQELHDLRGQVLTLRRIAVPTREMVRSLLRVEEEVFAPSTRPYLQDLYDHALRIVESAEFARENLTWLRELHLATVSNRMNEVMKVLTVIATLFIPLTFITGVYGMNFKYMPELEWRYGYPAAWGVMSIVAGGMVVFFRRRNWW